MIEILTTSASCASFASIEIAERGSRISTLPNEKKIMTAKKRPFALDSRALDIVRILRSANPAHPGFPADFEPNKYVDCRTAGAALGVSPTTLKNYADKGLIKRVKLTKRKILYEWASIQALLGRSAA